MAAPEEAVDYYGLDPEKNPTMRDVILCVRADESMHRSINHHFSDIPAFYDIKNPEVELRDSFQIEGKIKPAKTQFLVDEIQDDDESDSNSQSEEQELRAKLRM